MYELSVAIWFMAPHCISTRSITVVAKNDRIVSVWSQTSVTWLHLPVQ